MNAILTYSFWVIAACALGFVVIKTYLLMKNKESEQTAEELVDEEIAKDEPVEDTEDEVEEFTEDEIIEEPAEEAIEAESATVEDNLNEEKDE